MKLLQQLLEDISIDFSSPSEALKHILHATDFRNLSFEQHYMLSVHTAIEKFFHEDTGVVFVLGDISNVGDILVGDAKELLLIVRKDDKYLVITNKNNKYELTPRPVESQAAIDAITNIMHEDHDQNVHAYLGITEEQFDAHSEPMAVIKQAYGEDFNVHDLRVEQNVEPHDAIHQFLDNDDIKFIDIADKQDQHGYGIIAVRTVNDKFRVIQQISDYDYRLEKYVYTQSDVIDRLHPFMLSDDFTCHLGRIG